MRLGKRSIADSSPHVPSGAEGPPLRSIPALSCLSFPWAELPSIPSPGPLGRREGGGKGARGPGSGVAFLRPLLQSLSPWACPTSSPKTPPVAGPPAPEHHSKEGLGSFPQKVWGFVPLSPCHPWEPLFRRSKHLQGLPGLGAGPDVAVCGLSIFSALPPVQGPRCAVPTQVLGCYTGVHGAPPPAPLQGCWPLASGCARGWDGGGLLAACVICNHFCIN